MRKKEWLRHCRKVTVTYMNSANCSTPSRQKFQYAVTVNCASLVIKVLPWVWVSKSWTKISDFWNILIKSVNNSTTQVGEEPFVRSEEHTCFLNSVVWSVSRTHFCNWHHAGMVGVTGQEDTHWWECLCVRSDGSILEQHLCLGYVFTCTSSAAWPEKSPDSPLAISLPALCWISREVRTELSKLLVSWGRMFINHTLSKCHHSSLPFLL